MKRVPNMRLLVTIESKQAVLDNGGCTSFHDTPSTHYLWAVGKPDQVKRLMAVPEIEFVGKPELVPTFKTDPAEFKWAHQA